MTNIDSVIERIKKLLAHSDSAKSIGSQAESEAFAAKAAEIALQHKLEMSEIEFAAEAEADPIDGEYVNTADLLGQRKTRNRSAWQQGLVSALCYANSCRLLVVVGSKTVRLVGSKADREIVKYLFTTLGRQGERLANKWAREQAARTWRDVEWQEQARGTKRDFLLGFVRGIREKLAEQRKSTLAEAGQYAVVRVQTHERAVAQWIADLEGVRSTGALSGARDGASYRAGQAAGRSASLHGGIGGGTVSRASSMRLTA